MTCLGHRQQEEVPATLRSEGTSGGSSYYNPRETVAQEKRPSQEPCLGKGIQLLSRGGSVGKQPGSVPVSISSCPSVCWWSCHWLNPAGSQAGRNSADAAHGGCPARQDPEGREFMARSAALFIWLALWIEGYLTSAGSHFWSTKHWHLASSEYGIG